MKSKIPHPGEKIKIQKIKASSGRLDFPDIIPREVLCSISLNGHTVSTISCSPVNLIELAAGYLINNGYIKNHHDIKTLKICCYDRTDTINRGDLSLRVEVEAASTGYEGRQSRKPESTLPECSSIDDFISQKRLKKVESNLRVSYDIIFGLNMKMVNSQKYKKEFGGLHSAALFDKDGSLINTIEDIGRHNCIDKIAGYISISGLTSGNKIIFTSGRLSIDLVSKICKMKIPVIITNSSVTYGSAILAKKMNLTIIGYARGGRFNIYSSPRRITK